MPNDADRGEIAENLARIPTSGDLTRMAVLMFLSMAAIVVSIALLLP